MADAVLLSINNLIGGMNTFYITLFLLGTSIVMILLMLLKDQLWWRGLFLAMFGTFFDISIVYAVANGIVPSTVSYIAWLGYLFIIIGGVLAIYGLLISWVSYHLR